MFERTNKIKNDKDARGRGFNKNDKPIDGFDIGLEHISQYAQHPNYRSHQRYGRSDSDGYFRIAGLSYPPYVLNFTHPSFDKEFKPGVPETSPGTAKGDEIGRASCRERV